jgi:DNA gyrase/topoisomerase IV subunit A
MDIYQLEHNELMREFQIAQQEVQDLNTILSNKERDIEEIREVFAAELKFYQRKVKHQTAANQNEYSQAFLKNEDHLFLER